MLFCQKSTGRVTLARAGIKIEKFDAEHEPRKLTCFSAFVRLLAAAVAARASPAGSASD
jgi:hypothetical protein